jgi:hypothetical protein
MTLRCSIVLCGYIETAAEPREYLEKQLGFKAPKEEIYNAYHWVPQEKKRKEKKRRGSYSFLLSTPFS